VSQPKCNLIQLFSWILDDVRAPATGTRRVNLEPTDGNISPVSVRSALFKVAGYPGNFSRRAVAHASAPPQASRPRQARRRFSHVRPPPPPHRRHAVQNEGPQGRSVPPPALSNLGRDQNRREAVHQDALPPDHRRAPRPAPPSPRPGACRRPSGGCGAPARTGRAHTYFLPVASSTMNDIVSQVTFCTIVVVTMRPARIVPSKATCSK